MIGPINLAHDEVYLGPCDHGDGTYGFIKWRVNIRLAVVPSNPEEELC